MTLERVHTVTRRTIVCDHCGGPILATMRYLRIATPPPAKGAGWTEEVLCDEPDCGGFRISELVQQQRASNAGGLVP